MLELSLRSHEMTRNDMRRMTARRVPRLKTATSCENVTSLPSPIITVICPPYLCLIKLPHDRIIWHSGYLFSI